MLCLPTGLAIDYFNQRLYWADAELSVIGSVRFDGSDALVAIGGRHGKRADRQAGATCRGVCVKIPVPDCG